jgi:A/G-specific adenine glycosylase
MAKPDPAPSKASLRGLAQWYDRHRRDLPWRRTTDPYQVWVAETMLQQTTVKAVLPYFQAFLERFPTVAALAAALEEDVLAVWSGLGYYHRARNLHRGAREIVARHGGRFPRALPQALALPGVGLYTASAVLSITFGLPLAVVDGNVRRVLARLFALAGIRWRKDAALYNLATELLDREAPGEWNQALMELGATVCTPRRPRCPLCPLQARCQAHARGQEERFPESRSRRDPVSVTVAAALIEDDGRVLLVRRPAQRVLAGLWELPQTSLDSGEPPDLVSELEKRHGLRVAPGSLVATVRHAITFRRIRVEVYATRLRARAPQDSDQLTWARPDQIRSLPVSSLTHKILRAVRGGQFPLPL